MTNHCHLIVQQTPHRLKKAYWSQAHALYRSHFAQTDLFIIFGCSLGVSDGWWWRNIIQGLKQHKQQTYRPGLTKEDVTVHEAAELIIYWRQGSEKETVESVKDRFFNGAGVPTGHGDRQTLADSIHVVLYNDATLRTFLRTQISPTVP